MAVTRNDVAALAGVSSAVVSYVLNDGPRPVSESARARVLAAVDALGYKPDGLARSLRMGSTRTLGLIVPDASNPFFAELARAIEDEAFARGYAVLVGNSADDPGRERAYISNLAERRVDGLIFVSAATDQRWDDLTRLRIPVLAVDRSPDASPVSTIRSDNDHSAYAGTEHLLSHHGHRRVGFIGGPVASVTDDRRNGWARALSDGGGIAADEVQVPFTFAGGWRAAEALLGADDPPGAVLVSSDVQALGLLSWASAHAIAIPGDLAVVSIDGTDAGQYAAPALTSAAQPLVAMASAAVAEITKAIRDPHEPVHLTLRSELVIRRSCGCSADSATPLAADSRVTGRAQTTAPLSAAPRVR
jgi:LacI family transcriptional regulator